MRSALCALTGLLCLSALPHPAAAQAATAPDPAIACAPDPEAPACLLAQAFALATQLEFPSSRSIGLRYVGNGYAVTGALETAALVYAGALEAAAESVDPSDVQRDLAESVGEAGRITGDADLLAMSLSIGQAIKEPTTRDWILHMLALRMAESGDLIGATRVADGIATASERAVARAGVAARQALAGQADAASIGFVEARSALADIEHGLTRRRAMADIVVELARAGRLSTALTELAKADATTGLSPDVYGRIARARADAPNLIAMIGARLASIGNSHSKDSIDSIWREVAENLADMDQIEPALAAAARVKTPGNSGRMHLAIGAAEARAGDNAAADRHFDAARRTISQVREGWRRDEFVGVVAVVLAQAGRIDAALEVRAQASDDIIMILDPSLIEALARAGAVDAARDLASSMRDATINVALADGVAATGDVTGALAIAAEIDDPELLVLALAMIATDMPPRLAPWWLVPLGD